MKIALDHDEIKQLLHEDKEQFIRMTPKQRERSEQLWAIIHNAVVNTRQRPATRRGPWLISDEYLDECLKNFK